MRPGADGCAAPPAPTRTPGAPGPRGPGARAVERTVPGGTARASAAARISPASSTTTTEARSPALPCPSPPGHRSAGPGAPRPSIDTVPRPPRAAAVPRRPPRTVAAAAIRTGQDSQFGDPGPNRGKRRVPHEQSAPQCARRPERVTSLVGCPPPSATAFSSEGLGRIVAPTSQRPSASTSSPTCRGDRGKERLLVNRTPGSESTATSARVHVEARRPAIRDPRPRPRPRRQGRRFTVPRAASSHPTRRGGNGRPDAAGGWGPARVRARGSRRDGPRSRHPPDGHANGLSTGLRGLTPSTVDG